MTTLSEKIVVFQLSSGSNIIALVSREDSDGYIVDNPLEMKALLGKGGAFIITRWMPFNSGSNKAAIYKRNVQGLCIPDEEIVGNYVKHLHSLQQEENGEDDECDMDATLH